MKYYVEYMSIYLITPAGRIKENGGPPVTDSCSIGKQNLNEKGPIV